MKNPYIEHLQVYVNLMQNFLDGRISSAEFTRGFINRRSIDVRKMNEMVKEPATGKDLFDKAVYEYKKRKITEKECEAICNSLLQLTPLTSQICDIIDECHSDCSCCYEEEEGVPLDPPLVINGEMLRELVQQHLEKIRILAKEANLDV